MPKAHQPSAEVQQMRVSFMNQAGELWDQHENKFTEIMEQSEDRSIKVNFGATLDFTESKACLETTISYSQVFKDKRREEFEDPNQIALPLNGETENHDATPEGFKAREAGRKKGRKGAAIDVPAEQE